MAASDKADVEEIVGILRNQRNLLLTGQLGDLPEMISSLDELEDRLNSLSLGKEAMARLREEADRNSGVLLACISGVKSVRRRIQELSDPASIMQTYTREGRRRSLPSGTPVKGRTL